MLLQLIVQVGELLAAGEEQARQGLVVAVDGAVALGAGAHVHQVPAIGHRVLAVDGRRNDSSVWTEEMDRLDGTLCFSFYSSCLCRCFILPDGKF